MQIRSLTGFTAILLFVSSVLQLEAQRPELERPPAFLDEAMKIYAQLTGRTVLRPAMLPPLPQSIIAQIPPKSAAAITFIEGELAKNQIEVVRDGDRFVRLLPVGWERSPLATQLARLHPPPREERTSRTNEMLRAGAIAFENLPLDPVLEIYAQLRQRTVIRPAAPLILPIQFRTQTPLSREENIYALTVVLTLNGLAVIDDGDKFVQVVPIPQVPNVKLGAPRPERGAAQIAPEQVPVFRPGPASGGRAGRPNVDSLMEYYAELTGRTAVPAEKIGRYPVLFHALTPLTKPELVYAIEATLALDGLTVVAGDDNTVRAVRRSEVTH